MYVYGGASLDPCRVHYIVGLGRRRCSRLAVRRGLVEARERGKRGFMAGRRRKRRGAEKRGQFKLPLPSPPPFSPPPPLLCTYVTCVYSLLFGLQKPLTFSDRFETQPPIAEEGQKNWQVQLLFDQIEQPTVLSRCT